jgi:predicted dehydrogenase
VGKCLQYGGKPAEPGPYQRSTCVTDRDAHQPPGERLGWAIVGLGDFACNHILPAFAACARSKVTALVSGDRAKAQRVARQYGVPEDGVYTYDTFDQLRDNPAVDVVYIILPNALHGEYTIKAAQAGKHVFCEKPMAPSSAECEAMIAARTDAQVPPSIWPGATCWRRCR